MPTQSGDVTISISISICQVIIDYLLEGNADPNVFNEHGETPLHSAIKRHRRSHVQKFLARGANPNKG